MLRLPKIRKFLGQSNNRDYSPTFEYRGRVLDEYAKNLFMVLEKKSSRDFPDLVFINATASEDNRRRLWGFYSSYGQNMTIQERDAGKLQFSSPLLIRKLRSSAHGMWDRSDRKEVVTTLREGAGILLDTNDVDQFNQECSDPSVVALQSDPLTAEEIKKLSAVNAINTDGSPLDLSDAVSKFSPGYISAA